MWASLNTIIITLIADSSLLMSISVAHAEYGDIILNSKAEAMRKAEVGDVVFPHWFHRIRYRCNVCHENIFELKAGSNDISMKIITEDHQMCGKCHNGFIASSALECETCHSLEPGWSPGPIQHSIKKIIPNSLSLNGHNEKMPVSRIYEIGNSEHPIALSQSGLPLDKYGLVDWAEAVRRKILDPLWSLDPDADIKQLQTRNTRILFESNSPHFPNVIFPHKIHSYWLQCKICHQTKGGVIFNKNTGSNPVSMRDISKTKWCGRCHNKVSFPINDCYRCHTHRKNSPVDKDIIIRDINN